MRTSSDECCSLWIKNLYDVQEQVIDRETVEANKVRTVVLAEEAAANIKADEAKAIKEDTEAELQIVMPILEEALRVWLCRKPQ